MSGAPVALLALGLLLLAVGGALAAMETALVRVSKADAGRLVTEGRNGASALLAVLELGPKAMNTAIFLRVAFEMGAAVAMVLAVETYVQAWWLVFLVAGTAITVASFVLAGVSPRTVGRQHPLGVALKFAPTLRAATSLLSPIAQLLVLIGNAVTPGRGYRHGPFASEDEFRDLVDLAGESDVIEAEERRMIQSVFEIGETRVREVMVPRPDMVVIPEGTSLSASMDVFLNSGFSRIPVTGEGGLDDPIGVLYLKDVVRRLHWRREDNESMPVERAMRPPFFVPESLRVETLLRQMQGHLSDRESDPHLPSGHVVLVVDEYGGTAGLVTIEDLVEEIVGEISDEYDKDAPTTEQLGPDNYRVSARLPIDELGELFGLELDDDDVDSVGGLLAKEIGSVPIPGSTCVSHGLVLAAEGLVGRRNKVASILVHRASPHELKDGDEHVSATH